MALEGQKPVIAIMQKRFHKVIDFMFCGCFSWDWNGLYFYWKNRTATKKKLLKKKLKK